MAYEKQTWVDGEVITDTKLNHMEEGIASAGGSKLVMKEFISDVYTIVSGATIGISFSISDGIEKSKIRGFYLTINETKSGSGLLVASNIADFYGSDTTAYQIVVNVCNYHNNASTEVSIELSFKLHLLVEE